MWCVFLELSSGTYLGQLSQPIAGRHVVAQSTLLQDVIAQALRSPEKRLLVILFPEAGIAEVGDVICLHFHLDPVDVAAVLLHEVLLHKVGQL